MTLSPSRTSLTDVIPSALTAISAEKDTHRLLLNEVSFDDVYISRNRPGGHASRADFCRVSTLAPDSFAVGARPCVR